MDEYDNPSLSTWQFFNIRLSIPQTIPPQQLAYLDGYDIIGLYAYLVHVKYLKQMHILDIK